MAQSVTDKQIERIGWNIDAGAGYIIFASANIGGTVPSGCTGGTLGVADADTKLWSAALAAASQGIPVSCDGTNAQLGTTGWEKLKQINFLVPQ